jgi:hypothetical protein
MGNYRVLAPVGFVRNGEGVTHSRPGAVVEVDDDQAKSLVAAGKLEPVKESKAKAADK